MVFVLMEHADIFGGMENLLKLQKNKSLHKNNISQQTPLVFFMLMVKKNYLMSLEQILELFTLGQT